jgi:filamentous hemagglutinin family protein
MKRSWIQALAIAGLEIAVIALALPVSAQIEADATLGAERSRLTPNAILRRRADRAGTSADLIEGGVQRAGNLFHSFSRFNVNDGQSVYFDNPDGVNNIFGRITGTEISNILGTLGVDGNANLFLLNPNGILFGPNARLDVNGSFVGSTANAIQFGNQGFFSTTDAAAPPLLTVNPSAFLFNQINPNAQIVNQSITPLRFSNIGGVASGLEVPIGHSLLLLGGDVILAGGSGINAVGGRVELGGLASPGTVGLTTIGDQLRLSFPENAVKADVTLRDGASVDVVGDNGGDVAVNARNVNLLNGSNIFAGIGLGLGFTGAQAGDVEINASGVLTLSDASFIQSSVFGGALGDSGNVRITSQSVNLLNGSALGSAVAGQGQSGEVRVQATDAITLAGQNAEGTGSAILSLVGALDGFIGSGEGSDINLQARSLVLADGAQIGTTNLNAIGDAGDIQIDLADSLLMQGDRTAIQAGTAGEGNGGNIVVRAGNTVDLRSGARFLTITAGTGNAGNVTITAGNSVVFDGVSTDFDFDGFNERSGINSSVQPGGTNSRRAGAITINTDRFTISNSAGILSNIEANAVGVGAGITINADSMQMLNGGQIQSLLRGSELDANGVLLAPAQGSAGNININLTGDFIANPFVDNNPNFLGSRSEIFTSAGNGTVGDAGDIAVRARNITLQNGSRIVSDTSGRGNSGSVTLQATEQVLFDGIFANPDGGDPFRSGVFSSINRNPDLAPDVLDQRIAGDVNVNAGSFVLRQGGSLYANVEQGATGQGGNINITGGSVLIQDGSQIQSILRGEGQASGARGRTGDVNVTLTGGYRADGEENNQFSSAIFTSVEPGTIGNAGNITVQARTIELTNGARFVTETEGQGNAGRVTIGATDFIRFDGFGRERSGVASSVKSANGNPIGRVAGDVILTGGNFIISNGAAILTNVEAGADGIGGDIVINANNLSMLNSAFIQSLLRGADGETAGGTGATGNVDINLTGDFVARGINPLEPDSNEISTSAGRGTRGNAGNISVDARSVRFFNGSRLVTETAGQGDAGSVTITARTIGFDGANMDDPGNEPGGSTRSGISSSVFAAPGAQRRQAGAIRINRGAVRLSNGATIFSNVEAGAVGRGGNIIIDAESLTLRNTGQLQTFLRGSEEANGGAQGRPGTITLRLSKDFTALGVGDGLSNGLFTSVGRNTVGDAGNITVRARSIRLQDGSRFVTETNGQGNAGRVTVTADRSIRFDGDNQDTPSGIASSVFAADNTTQFRRAGNIQINAGNLIISNDAIIFSNVEAGAAGRSGNILIDANSMVLTEGGQIQSLLRGADPDSNLVGARGATGLVNINLDGTLSISRVGDNASAIFTLVEPGTSGNAGRVVVRAGAIGIENTGIISSSTSGAGNGGPLNLQADREIAVRSGGDIQTVATEQSSGEAGAVKLDTRRLTIEGAGSSISATSQFTRGGNIVIDAEVVTVQDTIVNDSRDGILASSELGQGGRITFLSGLEMLQIDNGSVSASTRTGEAGSLRIQGANLVRLTDSAILSVAANGGGGGSGNMSVNTRTLRVENGARISASTVSRRSELGTQPFNNPNTTPGSGNITLRNLESLEVDNGTISASTRSGQAGTLIVDAAEGSVELRNRGRLRVAASETGGNAGDLEVTTRRFFAENSTASVSSAAGQAGNLTVDANAVQLDNGRLTARTAETGANISLQNVQQLYLRNGSQISAPASEFATGGNVTLDNADGFTVAVPAEDNDIIADATLGQGGNINIDTLGIYNFRVGLDQPVTNDIDASSQFNRQGSVNINTPDTDPSRGLIELPSGVVDASQQIDQTCRATGTDEFGEFVVTGRGGLPPNPNEVLDNDETVTNWVGLDHEIPEGNQPATSSLPANATTNAESFAPIVEAEGWVVGADGKVMLVAQTSETDSNIFQPVQCP